MIEISSLTKKIFPRTPLTRAIFFLVVDIILIIAAIYLSFWLRFDGKIPVEYLPIIQKFIILALVFLLPLFLIQRLYSFSWSYVSTNELISLFKATTLGFLLLSIALYFSRDFPFFQGFPRSTLFISYFLVFIFCGGIRISKRIYLETFKGEGRSRQGTPTLIVGAGDAGEQLLRNILNSKTNVYSPLGFVDDNPMKQGEIIHGFKVLGKVSEIPKIVSQNKVEEMIITFPSVATREIKKAAEIGRSAGVKKIKIIPSINEIIDGEISLGNIREVQVEDLLGRDAVSLNTKLIENFIRQKIVLITGAAGSIGCELSRQTARFVPSLLLLLDQDETGIFNILEELKDKYSKLQIFPLITDIQDKVKIEKIFTDFHPNIVFHAAAYKHVPLMEAHPDEAVKNNVFGTKIVAEAALRSGAEKLVFISTDKAVNPSSVMGATKRIGEMICQAFNQRDTTRFISVRFGNVLDSRGSVIPIFREQIKKGGPVTVTHPEMKRYFMVTAEAILLVMQAASLGSGGEVFVLDMGEPIKILDLAKEMIRFSGFEPDRDIPIVFTGIRPGEKLFEEMLTAEEGTIATENKKIFMARLAKVDGEKLNEELVALAEATRQGDRQKIRERLKALLPTYKTV